MYTIYRSMDDGFNYVEGQKDSEKWKDSSVGIMDRWMYKLEHE